MTEARRSGHRVGILSSVHSALDTRVFHKQARTLAKAGYEVTLIAQHGRSECVDGVRIIGLPANSPRWRRPWLWLLLLIGALRLRAQVYHVHDPELLPLALILQTLSGRPVIYDVHEYYGDEIRTRQWIPAPLRAAAALLTDGLEKVAARRLAGVITVNEHMNTRFLALQPRSIAVHNYPPAEYFDEPSLGQREQMIAYTGVLTSDRGLGTIFRAGQILRPRFPGMRILIAGIVDWSGLEKAIPREPSVWENEAGVSFLGLIQQTQVPALLARATAGWIPFLPTANNRRSTPNKLLEYMAAGLPAVVSNFGYMRDIVQEARCGLLATAEDPASHADLLATLLDRPDEAAAMGKRGREAVLERYSWAAEGEKLVRFYDEILGVTSGCP
jgi:glycosyltransferase involved in cell wall biosynthesis